MFAWWLDLICCQFLFIKNRKNLKKNLSEAPDVSWLAMRLIFFNFGSETSNCQIYFLDDLLRVLWKEEGEVKVDQSHVADLERFLLLIERCLCILKFYAYVLQADIPVDYLLLMKKWNSFWKISGNLNYMRHFKIVRLLMKRLQTTL